MSYLIKEVLVPWIKGTISYTLMTLQSLNSNTQKVSVWSIFIVTSISLNVPNLDNSSYSGEDPWDLFIYHIYSALTLFVKWRINIVIK